MSEAWLGRHWACPRRSLPCCGCVAGRRTPSLRTQNAAVPESHGVCGHWLRHRPGMECNVKRPSTGENDRTYISFAILPRTQPCSQLTDNLRGMRGRHKVADDMSTGLARVCRLHGASFPCWCSGPFARFDSIISDKEDYGAAQKRYRRVECYERIGAVSC